MSIRLSHGELDKWLREFIIYRVDQLERVPNGGRQRENRSRLG